MIWNKEFWYTHWPRVGLITAVYMIILIVFNSKAPIGSVAWLVWMSVPLYMIHQYEEYVFPGGFQKEMNIILSKSDSHKEILTNSSAFWINIIYIWIAGPVLILLGQILSIFTIIWITLFVVNGIVHVVGAVIRRKYNPGLILSLLFNIPLGLYIVIKLGIEQLATVWEMIVGIILGIIFHGLLFVILIKKSRNIQQIE